MAVLENLGDCVGTEPLADLFALANTHLGHLVDRIGGHLRVLEQPQDPPVRLQVVVVVLVRNATVPPCNPMNASIHGHFSITQGHTLST